LHPDSSYLDVGYQARAQHAAPLQGESPRSGWDTDVPDRR
jgi:hypothetical protein